MTPEVYVNLFMIVASNLLTGFICYMHHAKLERESA